MDDKMKQINERILAEFDEITANAITDGSLINEYNNCKSVKNKINELRIIINKHTDQDTTEKIIAEYSSKLIPAGTKGVIRGNKFNSLVKERILSLCLDINKYSIFFEKKHNNVDTAEIPDWYISDNTTNKIIIGMNQLDLWSGGQQLNRGFKYIKNNKYPNNVKLLCVVCNWIQLSSTKNKSYELFDIGFSNDTLCYLNNLENIIINYFTNID